MGSPQCPGSPGCRELHHKGDFLPVEVCEQDRPNTAIDVFQQEKGGIGKSLLRPEKDDRNGILIFELVSAFFLQISVYHLPVLPTTPMHPGQTRARVCAWKSTFKISKL